MHRLEADPTRDTSAARYGGASILDDVDLSVAMGDLVLLIGPSVAATRARSEALDLGDTLVEVSVPTPSSATTGSASASGSLTPNTDGGRIRRTGRRAPALLFDAYVPFVARQLHGFLLDQRPAVASAEPSVGSAFPPAMLRSGLIHHSAGAARAGLIAWTWAWLRHRLQPPRRRPFAARLTTDPPRPHLVVLHRRTRRGLLRVQWGTCLRSRRFSDARS